MLHSPYTLCNTLQLYTVCYTVIENREVILQYTLELTIRINTSTQEQALPRTTATYDA